MQRPLFRPALLATLLAAAPLIAPAAAMAQTVRESRFDLVLRGLKAGELVFAGTENGTNYAVTGVLRSAGLAGMVRKVRYDATAQGAVSGNSLAPRRYEEEADTGKRQSQSVMVWTGGVPKVELNLPERAPRPNDVSAASQKGSVDPLTAMFSTLREVPTAAACTTNVKMYDGRRSSQLRLSSPKVEGDRITCTGEYRRIAGFSDKEMAEKTSFSFALTYAPTAPGRVQVSEVAMDTLYGSARLTRR
ncbi:MAG: DUF3108 domain-containing protein [Gemmobacter sp.]|nr:DUF3108 domain-containing protein [Gemmobacter sp.]